MQGVDLRRREPNLVRGPLLEPLSTNAATHAAPVASRFHHWMGRPAGTPVIP
jgi:hypothetical protein